MRRCALIALAIVMIGLAGAPEAFAHATLRESSPTNEAVLRRSPPAVTLTFSEAVETAFGRFASTTATGRGSTRERSPDLTRARRPVTLDRQAPGFLHGHLEGDFRRRPPRSRCLRLPRQGGDRLGSCEEVFRKGTPGEVDAFFKFSRAPRLRSDPAGRRGAALLSSFARRRPSFGRDSAGSSPGSPSVSFAGDLCIVLQGAVAGGFGLSAAFRWSTVDSVLQTQFGKAFLLQMASRRSRRRIAFIASRQRSIGVLTLVPALCLLPTLSAAGHAHTSGAVAVAVDVVHLAAGSIWVGGLSFTVLALLLAGADRWPLAARAVRASRRSPCSRS